MQTTEDLVQAILDARKKINEFRAQSPETAEALRESEQYHSLFQELLDRCKQASPNIVPMPYPVYPWWQYQPRIWNSPSTITIKMDSSTIAETLDSKHSVRLM